MKVCIIHNIYPFDTEGGSEKVVRQTIESLAQAGHEVVLITSQEKKTTGMRWMYSHVGAVGVYRFRTHNLYAITASANQPVWKRLLWHVIDMMNVGDARTLRQILKKENPSIVHGHNLKGMSFLAPLVCHHLDIPYVQSLHGYHLLHPYGTFRLNEQPPFFRPKILARLYQAWNRHIYKTTTGLLTPSKLPLQLHQQVGFFTTCKTLVLPSPVTILPSSPPEKILGKLKVVFFGAIVENKGIRSLVTAVMQLPPTYLTLDIYGTGTLEVEMKKLTSPSENIFWRGYINDLTVLRQFDVLIYPSICYETQGLSMAEALVSGIPVIAANIGSLPETIEDGTNGYLFPSGDTYALRELLENLSTRPQRIRQLHSFSIPAHTKFNPQVYLVTLISFYQSCLRVTK